MSHQEIKEALAAATRGKWEVNDFDMMYSAEIISEYPEGYFNAIASRMYVPNAHLIANAPTWLQQLLEENEKLEKESKEYRSAMREEIEISAQVVSEREELIIENERLAKEIEKLREIQRALVLKGVYPNGTDR